MKRFLNHFNCCGSKRSQTTSASSGSGGIQNASPFAQNGTEDAPPAEVLRCGLYLDDNLLLEDFASVWSFLDNRLGRAAEQARSSIPHNHPGVTAVTLNHNERVIYFQILKNDTSLLDEMKGWSQVKSVEVEPEDFYYSIL